MHNYRKRWAAVFFNFTIILSIMAFRLSPATAQGTRADYERAAQLQRLTDGKVFRTHVRPQWFDDGNHLWYRVPTGADSCEFVLVDAENGIRQPAFDHARLAEALAKAGLQNMRADRLSIGEMRFHLQEHEIDVHTDGRWWRCNLEKYEVRELTSEGQVLL